MDSPDRERLVAAGADADFTASSDVAVGHLLTVLAASKPGGRILELGTGVGVGTACLLRGMDADAALTTVEADPTLSSIAQRSIPDPRVEWVVAEGGDWLEGASGTYDLAFADTWPGKFTHLDDALALVGPGGLYVVDDLRPQPDWPADHLAAVRALRHTLDHLPGWVTTSLDAASGVYLCARRPVSSTDAVTVVSRAASGGRKQGS